MKNFLKRISDDNRSSESTSEHLESKPKKRKADDVSRTETYVPKLKLRSCQCTRCRSLASEPVIKKVKVEKDEEDLSDNCNVYFKTSLESVVADYTSIVLEGMIHGLNGYKPKVTNISISGNVTPRNKTLTRKIWSDDKSYLPNFHSGLNLSTRKTETVISQPGDILLDHQSFSVDKVKAESENVLTKPFESAFKLDESSAEGEVSVAIKQESATTLGSLGARGSMIVGDNIIQPKPSKPQVRTGLRPVFIDGSNVAMGHTNGKCFSVRGLDMCIQFFVERGHDMVIAFVPLFRRKARQTTDLARLLELEDEGHVVFTPSRKVGSKLHICYDDRYTVQCANELGGVIVSMDNFRDLKNENKAWVETINTRLLMFTWVGDMLIFPSDPMGKHGVSLDELLSF